MGILDQSVTARIQSGVLPTSLSEARLGSGGEGAGIARYVTWPSASQTSRSKCR